MKDNLTLIKQRLWIFLRKAPPLLLAVIIVGLSSALYFAVIGQSTWGTNDDVVMSLLAAGKLMAVEPTADLHYIHYIYGTILRELYEFMPDVPWYAIAFITIILASLTALNVSILIWARSGLLLIILFFATFALLSPAMWHLQFTIVSGFASLGGVLLILSLLLHVQKNLWDVSSGVICGIILISLGAMVRFESMLMIFILTIPTCGIICIFKVHSLRGMQSERRRFIRRTGLSGLLLLVAIASLAALEHNHYRTSPEWDNWYKLRMGMRRFFHYPEMLKYNAKTSSAYEKIGWGSNDYAMIESWQFIDPERYSLENFDTVIHQVLGGKGEVWYTALEPSRLKHGIVLARKQIRKHFKKTSLIFLLLIFSVAITLGRGRATKYMVASLFASGLFIYAYIFLGLNRAPLRVIVPVVGGMVWFLLLFSCFNLKENGRTNALWHKWSKRRQFALIFVLIVACGFDMHRARGHVEKRLEQFQYTREMVVKWQESLPEDAIIYSAGGSFPYEFLLPLKSYQYLDLGEQRGFIGTGWPNQSPHQRLILHRLKLDQDFFAALATRKHVYMVERYSEMAIPSLTAHYRNVYGIKLKLIKAPLLPGLLRMEFSAIR